MLHKSKSFCENMNFNILDFLIFHYKKIPNLIVQSISKKFQLYCCTKVNQKSTGKNLPKFLLNKLNFLYENF